MIYKDGAGDNILLGGHFQFSLLRDARECGSLFAKELRFQRTGQVLFIYYNLEKR